MNNDEELRFEGLNFSNDIGWTKGGEEGQRGFGAPQLVSPFVVDGLARPPPTILPLRQWIQCARKVCKKGDDAYLKSAVRIAMSLTKQISQDMNLKGNLMSRGEWADLVVVRLKEKISCSGRENEPLDIDAHGLWEPLPFALEPNQGDQVVQGAGPECHNGKVSDIDELDVFLQHAMRRSSSRMEKEENDEFDTFLEHAIREELAIPERAQQIESDHPSSDLKDLPPKLYPYAHEHEDNTPSVIANNEEEKTNLDDIRQEFASFILGSLDAKQPENMDDPSLNPHQADDQEVDYLNVDSAEISWSDESQGSSRSMSTDENERERQILYCLGLLCYELFSGKAPPIELHALASSQGAFISMPKLAHTKESSDQDQRDFNRHKRRQGPSGSKLISLCQRSSEYLSLVGVPASLSNMVLNMLDSVYGMMSGVECYTNIADVLLDLCAVDLRPSKLLQDLDVKRLSISGLQLDELTGRSGDLNLMTLTIAISNVLCMQPRLVKSLAELIYARTHGNTELVKQTLLLWHNDGILCVDLRSKKWVWDEEKMRGSKLPDIVAKHLVNNKIPSLSLEVQSAIHTCSLFGSSISVRYVEEVESKLGIELSEPLKRAESEGLVSNICGSIQFSHASIQEAAYDLVMEQDRPLNHLAYGRCLVKQALESSDDDMFFTAVNQINLGGPAAISNKEEYFQMAQHNLTAGEKALGMSSFCDAYNYFDSAMSFLRKGHWNEHYEFSLKLYTLSAQCCLANKNTGDLRIISDQVLKKARCFDDELETHFVILQSLPMPQALEKGIALLSKLGEFIPDRPTKKELDEELIYAQSLVRGIDENDILGRQFITDSSTLMKMKILCRLESICWFVKPCIHPFIILKMLKMTMSYGLCSKAPLSIVYFSSYLSKLGDIRTGHRFARLAKLLMNKLEKSDNSGDVITLGTEVQCYIEPMQAAYEQQINAESAALSKGDFHSACLARLQHSINLLWSGAHLSVVEEKIAEACQFMREHGHTTSLDCVLIIQRSVQILTGKKPDATVAKELFKRLKDKQFPRQLMTSSFHNDVFLPFIMNGPLSNCAKFFNIETNESANFNFLLYSDSVNAFFAGLAAFQMYRTSRDTVWKDRGQKRRAALEHWNEHGSSYNFTHKYLLLLAEEHFSLGEFALAKGCYTAAIAAAEATKFIHEKALACECAARFYWETGDAEASVDHFTLAHEAYSKWGAVKKADKLFAYVKDKFAGCITLDKSRLQRLEDCR